MTIISKTDLLLNSLEKFYEKGNNFEIFTNLTDGKEKNVISLRLLDYLCTKYCKTNTVIFDIPSEKGKINLYNSYKNQLKAYSKLQFDPFRRHNRIQFTKDKLNQETTIAQLNFFKWVIEIGLVEWLTQNDNYNLLSIENNMSIDTKRKSKKNKICT